MAGEVDVANADGAVAARVADELCDQRVGSELAATGAQGALQGGDGIALGMDRAAVATAEPAVDARRSAVVHDAVDARRRPVRVEPGS